MRLERERCQLRPLEPADATALHGAYSDAETMWFWDTPALPALADTAEMVRRQVAQAADGSHRYWTVERREDGAVLGCCDLSDIDPAAGEAEVGFIFLRSVWGCGFAREAMGAVVAAAWSPLELQRLSARIHAGHARSAALLSALGFLRLAVPGPPVVRAGERRATDLWTRARPA